MREKGSILEGLYTNRILEDTQVMSIDKINKDLRNVSSQFFAYTYKKITKKMRAEGELRLSIILKKLPDGAVIRVVMGSNPFSTYTKIRGSIHPLKGKFLGTPKDTLGIKEFAKAVLVDCVLEVISLGDNSNRSTISKTYLEKNARPNENTEI